MSPDPQKLEKLLGLPYASRKDRDLPGAVDCWQLVALAQRELFGREMPPVEDLYESETFAPLDAAIGRTHTAPCRLLAGGEAEEPGDVIFWKFQEVYTHVGVVVDARRKLMLHVPRGGTSCIERYDEHKAPARTGEEGSATCSR